MADIYNTFVSAASLPLHLPKRPVRCSLDARREDNYSDSVQRYSFKTAGHAWRSDFVREELPISVCSISLSRVFPRFTSAAETQAL